MANDEHVARLLAGVEGWNQWRRENRGIESDVSGADLSRTDLTGANLNYADLSRADLTRADLSRAGLSLADLTRADLTRGKLRGATLSGADLSGATLSGATLSRTDLTGANLTRANLTGANLTGAVLNGAVLRAADLTRVNFIATVVGAVDLRDVHGLDTVEHHGPSTIGIDTLYKSGGQIPEDFLRGCGVPDSMIEYARALVAAERPIDYYSVFISYSSKDEALAERLHADLQARGVRCWYAPHDLKIGARIRVGIDEAIRLHDKLLLILSKHSVASDWVEKEVETAMEQERRQRRTVLFPIRLDTAVMKIDSGWPADVRRGRNIGDFCKWKRHDAYQEAFARLLRDLQAAPTTP